MRAPVNGAGEDEAARGAAGEREAPDGAAGTAPGDAEVLFEGYEVVADTKVALSPVVVVGRPPAGAT